MPLSNNYSLKTTKDQQRPCFICGKFTSSVLDAFDDFFFICLSHTKDSGFCSFSEIQFTKESAASEESEIETLKKENSELKKNNKEVIETEEINPQNATIDANTSSTATAPKIVYKLHRSILYLREQEKLKKEKLNLLKSLK